jgi:hypothetical protein
MARHLVEAHGADLDGLSGYAPTLEQLHFAHADTHRALASIHELPPDRHTHPLPMNAGWWAERAQSFRPFQPSAAAREDPFGFPWPCQTGLPHTGTAPRTEADLADWAAGRPFNSPRPNSIKHSAAIAAGPAIRAGGVRELGRHRGRGDGAPVRQDDSACRCRSCCPLPAR